MKAKWTDLVILDQMVSEKLVLQIRDQKTIWTNPIHVLKTVLLIPYETGNLNILPILPYYSRI